MKAGIINVTGYAGIELARILSAHPEVDIVSVTGRSSAGQLLSHIFPHLDTFDMKISEEIQGDVDVVFSALPHGVSAETLKPFIDLGIKVIDISADFRIKDPLVYQEWYGQAHSAVSCLAKSVYGLPEMNRDEIGNAQLIANPGCYPTGAILALIPAVQSNIIESKIIIDSKSGVSGAGKKLDVNNLYSEVNESIKAYGLDGHRHLPEIKQQIDIISESSNSITFIPHLTPMTRGILSTCYATLNESALDSGGDLKEMVNQVYEDYYSNERFIKILRYPPSTKHTLGSNSCSI
ncbi:MAG: N-acetyl-gamma-glutamyl-phosphate reductase, partial [Nitrososphaerales archaeon]|nr:N-acetyl-gamma-glutamyl-phosphate reductase [Nitrososphaerales archaeon]